MTPRPVGRQLGGEGSNQNDVFGTPMMVTRQTGAGRAYQAATRATSQRGPVTERSGRWSRAHPRPVLLGTAPGRLRGGREWGRSGADEMVSGSSHRVRRCLLLNQESLEDRVFRGLFP